MTSLTLPRRLGLPTIDARLRRGALLAFGATLAAGLVVLAGLSVGIAVAAGDAIAPRVSVGGIEVGGLERADARARLTAGLPSLASGQATIVIDGDEAVVPYAEIGRGYEIDAMLDRALGVGRRGGLLLEAVDRLRALLTGIALPVHVHAFDDAAIDRAVAEIAERYSRPAVDASVRLDESTFRVTPAEAGRRLDDSLIRATLGAAVASPDPADMRLTVDAALVRPRVGTADARAAADAANAMAADLALTIPNAPDGEKPIRIAAGDVATWIRFGPHREQRYAATVDEGAVTAAVEALADSVNGEPRNASFELVGTGLGGVVPGADGRALDVAGSVEAIGEALRRRAAGTTIPSLALAVDVTEPALTTAAAEAALPSMQLVSSWTTYYTPGEGNFWGANITIPAKDIDGRVLAPGDEFEFWSGIGPVTAERGYGYGGAIIGGRSTGNVAIGGGICSTSTTLFNAALRYGLEMGERTNHYYFIPRYPTGLDATVFATDDYAVTMSFTNDTPNPIVIRGFGAPGWVRFDLWTIPVNRTVVLTNPIVSNARAAIETTQVDSSMAPGTSRRVEYPHDGFDASVTRYVYEADGTLLHQNTYFSSYRAVNGITAVGPTPPAPDPTPAPSGTPAPTPSP